MYLYSMARNNKQIRSTTSFHDIRTIGILYAADSVEDIKHVKNTTTKLTALGKDIYLLGYYNKKTLPNGVLPHTKDDFFCRKDLKWHNLPKEERINRFANEEFDYLLNVYNPELHPLLGVAALSKAKCRIGTFNKKYINCFDFMIKEKNINNNSALLDTLILYLYKLKND
ncbi:MAG: hypothetical protein HUU47_02975 [Bacteroidetes bacterium]|nr:hypothetical protein [Bacteroidota bacterium]